MFEKTHRKPKVSY